MACQKALFHALFCLATITVIAACTSQDSDTGNAIPELESPGNELDQPGLADPSVESTILIPPVVADSDLDRLLKGVKRQAANTLILLNRKLSSGELLSIQENECLATYDPANGEPLLAIKCTATPLTAIIDSRTVRISIADAAFYDTNECRNSLTSGHSIDCQLRSADMDISTEWVIPPAPALPYPIAGAQITYALQEPVLVLQSVEGSPTEPFLCTVDLLTALATSTVNSCETVIPILANRLDELVF
jgi:hypothetical protein